MANLNNCIIQSLSVTKNNSLTPVGTILMYVNGNNPPAGWLFCDGDSISQSEYSDLFSVIGTTFGGSGGNFNLPDLKDRIPIGIGNNYSPPHILGYANGSLNHAHTTNHHHQFSHSHSANHVHGISEHNHSIPVHYHMFEEHNHEIGDHNHTFSHNHSGQSGGANTTSGRFSMGANIATSAHGHPFSTGEPNPTAVVNNSSTTGNNSVTTSNSPSMNTSTNSSETETWLGSWTGLTSETETDFNNESSEGNNPPFLTVKFIIKY
jgi:microcystin-dependent protein